MFELTSLCSPLSGLDERQIATIRFSPSARGTLAENAPSSKAASNSRPLAFKINSWQSPGPVIFPSIFLTHVQASAWSTFKVISPLTCGDGVGAEVAAGVGGGVGAPGVGGSSTGT